MTFSSADEGEVSDLLPITLESTAVKFKHPPVAVTDHKCYACACIFFDPHHSVCVASPNRSPSMNDRLAPIRFLLFLKNRRLQGTEHSLIYLTV